MQPVLTSDLKNDPHFQEALKVAYYHCVLEMPLKSIGSLLGKSPATITRRLDMVRRLGWLRDRPEFCPPDGMWSGMKASLLSEDVARRLTETFEAIGLVRFTVLPLAVGETRDAAAQALHLARVGRFAARRLEECLGAGSHTVGVNWGWSVRHCIANLRPAHPNPSLRFVPLVGSLSLDENDPHFEEAIECSSNRLTQLAASAFGAPRAPRLSTPAYIPRRFATRPDALAHIREFITGDTSYRQIFGDGSSGSGMIAQIDTLVTGLSSIDVTTLPSYRPNLINPDDIPVLQRAGVAGDLGLHLLLRNDAEPDGPRDTALVEQINSLIVGAAPSDFVAVAERARQSPASGPGVIVVAAGDWKAAILCAAIRLGAVNELITDLETANAMLEYESNRNGAT